MSQTLKVEYDMEEMFLGIKDAIQQELGKELAEEIKSELKGEIRAELFSKIREDIQTNTYDTVQKMISDIYDNEKVVIGGGWNEEPKEYTLREYVIQQIKDVIANNGVEKGKKSYSNITFQDWFREKCVAYDIQRIIDKEIANIRNDVNYKVKNMFDQSTKTMLSDAVLNVLMANETYKKIENNIACIASKSEA